MFVLVSLSPSIIYTQSLTKYFHIHTPQLLLHSHLATRTTFALRTPHHIRTPHLHTTHYILTTYSSLKTEGHPSVTLFSIPSAGAVITVCPFGEADT